MTWRPAALRSLLSAVVLAVALLAVIGVRPAAALSVERIVTPAGIEVWLVPNDRVPVISLEFAFRDAGSFTDPPGLEGRANLATYLLDEGAGDLDSQAFQQRLADRVIQLGFDIGIDGFYGSLRTTSMHAEEAFELLRLALQAPHFEDEAIARMKAAVLGDIRRRVVDPAWLTRRAFFEAAFPDHPLSRPSRGTAASLEAIGRDDLIAFADAHFTRDRLVIAASGDITGEGLAAAVDHIFADLPASGAPIAEHPAEPVGIGTRLQVDREGPQSTLLMALPGIDREDPDFYAALVLNQIVGGSTLNSRLGQAVRGARGLTYGISSYLFETDAADLWMLSSDLSNENVPEALAAVAAVLEAVVAGDITAEELADAVRYLTGSYPLNFTSTDQVADRLLGWQTNGRSPSHIADRTAALEAVTLDDLARVAARLFRETPTMVIAGDPPTEFAPDHVIDAAYLAARELAEGS